MGRLEMEEGTKRLNEILDKDPENISALKPLFDIYKTQPDDAQFHDLAKQFLLLLSKDRTRDKMTIDVYNEYVRSVKKPRLPAVLYLRLISILSAQGQPEKAEPMLAVFLKKKPDLPGLAAALLKLANGYKKTGNYKKQRNCLTVLCKKFSDTPEARFPTTDTGTFFKMRCGLCC
jgi:tetratricopeptide (TPR) repeat protein